MSNEYISIENYELNNSILDRYVKFTHDTYDYYHLINW